MSQSRRMGLWTLPASMRKMNPITDPLRSESQESGILECEFQGESVPMILRHEVLRQAARDWQTFSSDEPFRVPIPSKENLRSMRQLPIKRILRIT
jgi:hypothetical protein